MAACRPRRVRASRGTALNARQRDALTAAIKTPPQLSKESAAVIARTMTTFNCYACHSRDKIGGPTEELNKFFLTTQQEMGDEGRLPPPLDGVGAKINPDYLKMLLDKGVHDRPYMHTHMPGFGWPMWVSSPRRSRPLTKSCGRRR